MQGRPLRSPKTSGVTMIARRNKEDNTYINLHRQALESVQELSGNKWTDFNIHDPGVTIIETALYALIELQYKLSFPLETYLSRREGTNARRHEGTNAPNTEAQTKDACTHPFAPSCLRAFAPSCVTLSDYETLFRETLREELADCRVTLVNGKYRIQVALKDNQSRKEVLTKIVALYHANRNICETLGKVDFEKQIIRPNDEATPPPPADAPIFNPPPPDETAKDIFSSDYGSFQYHFPDCYGINEKGTVRHNDAIHQAKIRQLKACLLIYDFMLANAQLQAGNIAELLRFSPDLPGDCKPDFSIPDMEKLIDRTRFKNFHFPSREFLLKQKSGFLDMLDILYGEDTKKMCAGNNAEKQHDASLIQKRIELLHFLPEHNARRFRSFNMMRGDRDNMPAVLQLVAIVYGEEVLKDIYWVEHILLSNRPDERNRLTVVFHIRLSHLVELDSLEQFIRERLPAHIEVRFIRLRHEKMTYFYHFHKSDKNYLFQLNRNKQFLQAKNLLSFLSENYN